MQLLTQAGNYMTRTLVSQFLFLMLFDVSAWLMVSGSQCVLCVAANTGPERWSLTADIRTEVTS